MNTDSSLLVSLLAGLGVLDVLAVMTVLLVKSSRRRAFARRSARTRKLRQALLDRDAATLLSLARNSKREFALLARLTLEACQEDDATLELLQEVLDSSGILRQASHDSRSPFVHRRIAAYLTLGLSGSRPAMATLLARLGREKIRLARLAILRQLATARIELPLEQLKAQLDAMDPPPDDTDFTALEPLAPAFHRYCEGQGLLSSKYNLGDSSLGDSGLRLFLAGVRARPSAQGWDQATVIAETRDDAIGENAARVLAEAFPPSWFLRDYRARREKRFMLPCARLLGAVLDPEEVYTLAPWFEREDLREAGLQAVREIERRHPEATGILLQAIAKGSEDCSRAISLALEYRLSYLCFHDEPGLSPGFRRMLVCLVDQDRTGAILSVLEAPLPADTRAAMIAHLKEVLETRPRQQAFFSTHADPALLAEMDLPPPPPEEDRPRIPVKTADKAFIAFLVIAALAVFPAVFAIRWWDMLGYLTPSELLYRFIFDFHYLFAWYTIAVNSFYLLLLILSAVKLHIQSLLWETGMKHFLFTSGLLPSVTIIAPAYNEEQTIADSVESLLSLAYPHYQVVVVNDGSRDGTMAALKEAFKLEPASSGTEGSLPSMPVKTVYRSPAIPNLIVVDKTNGGKADALNAGLNFAGGDYVCCIDADSLLDPQSLLRTMTQTIASRRTTIAIGGNIFPVNGSEVDHGHLQRIGLPGHPLAAFQTIEYLRSFESGRLGWALMDGLVIISGAYGIFRRDRILEAGGYMTGKGIYRKDTVGEDMELVVRLLRMERESGRTGVVDYCYNANCWTEVPEDGKALGRQRDRWHRGLIEVLLHHRKMAFAPRYGTTGLLSIPYFFMFELIGPWLELLGYVVLAASLILALINPIVSLAVFGIAILFGILISLSSILLAERQVVYFRPREFFSLILLAFAENFGFRQLMSMSRVWAFVQFFYLSKGWQKMARKGFARAAGKVS
ncbi:MAG: glycosyltransferase [Spirochaetia bacterium]|jgi:cellulose synthase/poly-beta-1,6-N-acetylglucosamine synthase-like glycosyltransferase|nr:glycosyltransferase [Spirochaetia bacterium]